eukprot:393479-Pelagomonas_calceolata.AAC.8
MGWCIVVEGVCATFNAHVGVPQRVLHAVVQELVSLWHTCTNTVVAAAAAAALMECAFTAFLVFVYFPKMQLVAARKGQMELRAVSRNMTIIIAIGKLIQVHILVLSNALRSRSSSSACSPMLQSRSSSASPLPCEVTGARNPHLAHSSSSPSEPKPSAWYAPKRAADADVAAASPGPGTSPPALRTPQLPPDAPAAAPPPPLLLLVALPGRPSPCIPALGRALAVLALALDDSPEAPLLAADVPPRALAPPLTPAVPFTLIPTLPLAAAWPEACHAAGSCSLAASCHRTSSRSSRHLSYTCRVGGRGHPGQGHSLTHFW